MSVEINTRRIQGTGGEVSWELAETGHVITVTDGEGTVQARLLVADGIAARDLYEHPFALSEVPNLFERAAEAA